MAYQIPGHVYHRAVRDEVVILDGRTDQYLSLNASAAVMWHAIAEGLGDEATVDRVVARYGIPADQARQDWQTLAAALIERGLIEPV